MFDIKSYLFDPNSIIWKTAGYRGLRVNLKDQKMCEKSCVLCSDQGNSLSRTCFQWTGLILPLTQTKMMQTYWLQSLIESPKSEEQSRVEESPEKLECKQLPNWIHRHCSDQFGKNELSKSSVDCQSWKSSSSSCLWGPTSYWFNEFAASFVRHLKLQQLKILDCVHCCSYGFEPSHVWEALTLSGTCNRPMAPNSWNRNPIQFANQQSFLDDNCLRNRWRWSHQPIRCREHVSHIFEREIRGCHFLSYSGVHLITIPDKALRCSGIIAFSRDYIFFICAAFIAAIRCSSARRNPSKFRRKSEKTQFGLCQLSLSQSRPFHSAQLDFQTDNLELSSNFKSCECSDSCRP
jgi:hypothetical protein